MRGRIFATVLAASLMRVDALAAGDGDVRLTPLHIIPTENRSAGPIPAGGRARVRLSSANPQLLAQALGVRLSTGSDSVEYVFDQYPQIRGPDARTWLEPTFVIDYNEPAFAPLREELAAAVGAVVANLMFDLEHAVDIEGDVFYLVIELRGDECCGVGIEHLVNGRHHAHAH